MSRFARFKQFNAEERALLEEALISFTQEVIDNDDYYDIHDRTKLVENRTKLLAEMKVSNETS